MSESARTYNTANRKRPIPPMPDLTNYLTTAEAAAVLGFHVNHIRRMIRRGDLEIMRVGNMIFVSKDSIAKYQESTKGYEKHSPLKRENISRK